MQQFTKQQIINIVCSTCSLDVACWQNTISVEVDMKKKAIQTETEVKGYQKDIQCFYIQAIGSD